MGKGTMKLHTCHTSFLVHAVMHSVGASISIQSISKRNFYNNENTTIKKKHANKPHMIKSKKSSFDSIMSY